MLKILTFLTFLCVSSVIDYLSKLSISNKMSEYIVNMLYQTTLLLTLTNLISQQSIAFRKIQTVFKVSSLFLLLFSF